MRIAPPEGPGVPRADLVSHLERHFAKLGTIGNNPDGSISRIAYSDEESAAMAYIRAEGEEFGLVGSYCPVGNLVLSVAGKYDRRLLVGSHLDSVPHGGNYDGAAGVVAGLEAIREILNAGLEPRIGVDLVVWRGEEHTFGAVYKGSSSAFGCCEPHILHNQFEGRSLREVMVQQGCDPSFVDEGQSSLTQSYIDSILGYLELHIEQGLRLEREGKQIGVVTSIAGDRRYLIVLEGNFDHSGATPMGSRYRKDVNLAMAYMQVRLDELGARRRAEGHDFVQTVGIVNADPEIDKKYPGVLNNSVTKVSGLGYFSLDIMSAEDRFMDDYAAEVHRLVWATAKEFGVSAFIEQVDTAWGIPRLDASLRSRLGEAAARRSYSRMEMPSGAGHDAVVVATSKRSDGSSIPAGMIFIPCRNGISHSGEEHAEVEDVARGGRVLQEVVLELVQ